MTEKYEWFAVIVIILLIASLPLGVYWGFLPVSDVIAVIPYFILTAIFGVSVWAYGKRIEKTLGMKRATPIEEDKDEGFCQVFVGCDGLSKIVG